jgi:transcriptional regulator with XRE-family HTH domain
MLLRVAGFVDKLEYQVSIGNRIRELRTELGVSQRQLALSVKKDPQSLERVENGKSCSTVYYLMEICSSLNVSMKDFFDFE